MTKEHKDKMKGDHPTHDAPKADDERFFDFDKTAGAETELENLEVEAKNNDRISDLEFTVQELKDKHLRLLAEFENYKKRTTRERLDLLNSASKEVMVSLLPVLDDFDRAKKSADDPSNEEVFSAGVSLVYNRLYNVLQSMGLKSMNSTGEKFDAELHEAITEIPVPDESMKGKVIDTLENGYMLNDKIIRHAKVVVGN